MKINHWERFGNLKFSIFNFQFSISLFLAAGILGCAAQRPVGEPAFSDRVLGDALHAVGLTVADLTIRGDYLEDSDRLEVVRHLLKRPLSGGRVVDRIAVDLTPPSAERALVLGGRFLGLAQKDLSGEEADGSGGFEGVPPSLAEHLRPLVGTLARVRTLVEAERSRFSPDERRRLRGLVALVDPEQQIAEAEADSLLGLARRVDLGALAAIALRLLRARDRFVEGIGALGPEAFRVEGAPIRLASPAGLVVVGGRGDDTYREAAALVVDLGGNDRYEAGAGVASEAMPVSVCIDLSGADLYASVQGRGLLGVGLLLDLAGDDGYEGEWGSQGSGLAGVGILEDRAGDDRYRAGLGSQGFGLYGIGILYDRTGRDRYAGDLLVQGAAGPGGAGILCEGAGDDAYDAGGRYRDFREGGAYFQSMAQGFGLGFRPLASGGIGVLYDGGGEDAYRAGYFAQGAAHWAGAGILIDRFGDDRYEARRYAQGCGSHMAVGLLQEGGGDDAYLLWGVGQGCGHDLSVGLLSDRAGNDTYRAVWLAQGAGNANGIGMLDEGAGNDRYMAEREDSQGYGSPSRDYGSIGLLIDRAGKDVYGGPGGEGRLWRGGMYGAGVDAPVRAPVDGQD